MHGLVLRAQEDAPTLLGSWAAGPDGHVEAGQAWACCRRVLQHPRDQCRVEADREPERTTADGWSVVLGAMRPGEDAAAAEGGEQGGLQGAGLYPTCK